MNVLTSTGEIDRLPNGFLDSVGTIFRIFGAPTQDSGNVSYGVEVAGRRFFVKTTDPLATAFLDYPARVELLRNAVLVARSCDHPVLPSLLNVIESPAGPMLIYEWVDGALLRDEAARRRFRRLPQHEILTVLDRIYALHVDLADAGWVAGDFYDGCLIYDFSRRRLHVVDLDSYHQGPFRNAIGRMFGSSRFMAPEEFRRGQLIDERTTVFTLGRTAAVLASDGSLDRTAFRGSQALHEVLLQACQPSPGDRFGSVRAFDDAWQRAR